MNSNYPNIFGLDPTQIHATNVVKPAILLENVLIMIWIIYNLTQIPTWGHFSYLVVHEIIRDVSIILPIHMNMHSLKKLRYFVNVYY